MRAVWYNLPRWNPDSENPLERGKADWRDSFKSKLDDLAYKEAIGSLPEHLLRNPVYEEVDYLHLFDPTEPLLTRFHRSASYKQDAIISPMVDDPYATPQNDNMDVDDKNGPYSPFDQLSTVKDKKKKYMNNFAKDDDADSIEENERREKKYRTLLEEINAEVIDDADYYDEDDDGGAYAAYDDPKGGNAEGDEISSLGFGGSTDGYQQNHHQNSSYKPAYYDSEKGREGERGRNAGKQGGGSPSARSQQSNYSSSNNNHRASIAAVASASFRTPTKAPSDMGISADNKIKGFGDSGSSSTKGARRTTSYDDSPMLGKSLHSAQAIQAMILQDDQTPLKQQSQPKSAMKQRDGSMSPTNSVKFDTPTGTIKGKEERGSTSKRSDDVPINRIQSSSTTTSSKKSNGNASVRSYESGVSPPERMSKSMQSYSALQKVFQNDDLSQQQPDPHLSDKYYQTPPTSSTNRRQTQQQGASLDSNRLSPLRATSSSSSSKPPKPFLSSRSSSNGEMNGTGGVGGGKGKSPYQSLSGDAYNSNGREYPILKPRGISSESITSSASKSQLMKTPSKDSEANNMMMTPQSVDSIPYQTASKGNTIGRGEGGVLNRSYLEQKNSSRKNGFSSTVHSNVDLETPQSTGAFTNVDSAKSYKFLSTSKKYIPTIDDFDSPDLFPVAYNTDNDYDSQQSPIIPVSSNSGVNGSSKRPFLSHNSRREGGGQRDEYVVVREGDEGDEHDDEHDDSNIDDDDMNHHHNRLLPVPSATSPAAKTNNRNESSTTTNTTASSTSSSSFVQKELNSLRMKYKDELKIYLLVGNITKTIQLLNETNQRLSYFFNKDEAIDLLWQCMHTENINDIPLINQSILFLLDEKVVDSNVKNNKGESLLQCAVLQDNEYLGRELIRRGSDILLMDNEGLCSLSLSLTYHYDWLVDEFAVSGREIQLLTKGSSDIKFQYVTFFILAGYASKAYEIIQNQYIQITPEEATDLLNSCRGNFENMKDPIETYELLESLGASVVDLE
jgi:hypothetical protein